MSHKLIDLNEPLRKLRDEGFNVYIHAGYLVVRDIPYVDSTAKVRYDGILVTSLDVDGEQVKQPSDHTIKFAGEYPCDSSGTPIAGIRQNSQEVRISEHLTTQHSFSSKPARGHYESYYEKIRTYAAILSGHAATIDPNATPLSKRVIEPEDPSTPFHYIDTASARADINMISRKLAVDKVAIVGLGGTGSYVLDLLAKTHVKEIHLYDGDKFSSHNAFRSPGAASKDDLHKQHLKVDYFKDIYSRMHTGVVAHGDDVDAANVDELRGMACVFLCIDAGPGKKFIVQKLEEFGITFIDTGMGLYAKNETLGGNVRVVTSAADKRDVARARISFGGANPGDEYDKNIQIADLNALNAVLAVMRWKKMRQFYFDRKNERFSIYTIGTHRLAYEDSDDPDTD
jgi:molybdopterin/thiamine biosynthesis adenylyltransferase